MAPLLFWGRGGKRPFEGVAAMPALTNIFDLFVDFFHLFSLVYHFPCSRRKLKSGLEVLLLLVSSKQTSLYLLKEIY